MTTLNSYMNCELIVSFWFDLCYRKIRKLMNLWTKFLMSQIAGQMFFKDHIDQFLAEKAAKNLYLYSELLEIDQLIFGNCWLHWNNVPLFLRRSVHTVPLCNCSPYLKRYSGSQWLLCIGNRTMTTHIQLVFFIRIARDERPRVFIRFV